jgi:hypothetical protein
VLSEQHHDSRRLDPKRPRDGRRLEASSGELVHGGSKLIPVRVSPARAPTEQCQGREAKRGVGLTRRLRRVCQLAHPAHFVSLAELRRVMRYHA